MNKFAYLVAASAFAVSAFGQGQISLKNSATVNPVNDASGKPLTGTSYLAQVWYGASAGALTGSFAPPRSASPRPLSLARGTRRLRVVRATSEPSLPAPSALAAR